MAIALICMTLVVLALVGVLVAREGQNSRERQQLYQRIQDPRLAVTESASKERRPSPAPIAADDDARFKEQRERRDDGAV